MANLGYLNLVKDINVEGWKEYLEQKAWAEKEAKDAANKSLWGTITGIVAAAATFFTTYNPFYAKAAYHVGKQAGRQVTEYTGYNPGYEAPDFSVGQFDIKEGLQLNKEIEKSLDEQAEAELIGVGSDLFSAVTSYWAGGNYADSITQAQTDLAAKEGYTFTEQIEGWTVEDGVVFDEAGLEVTTDELASMDISMTSEGVLIPEYTPGAIDGTSLWDAKSTSWGQIYDPVTGNFSEPNLLKGIMPGGEPWLAGKKFKYFWEKKENQADLEQIIDRGI